MKNKIVKILKEASDIHNVLVKDEKIIGAIHDVMQTLVAALKKGGKVIVFGNGGSASDSQHMVAEFIGRFKKERHALPAIALTTNTSTITALSNDYSYEIIFKRQLEALAKKEDVVIGISTSGNAKNVAQALLKAKEMGLKTVAITGGDGGRIKEIADTAIVIKSSDTPRIQEAHILVIHILCELVDEEA